MSLVTALKKQFFHQEVRKFYGVGAIATSVDWSVFTLLVTQLHLHYIYAVMVSYTCGSVTNYCFNKTFTFKCTSQMIFRQVSVFLVSAAILLLSNMSLLSIFIHSMHINEILARVMTTGIMLYPGYLLHRSLTFNKKIFKQANDAVLGSAQIKAINTDPRGEKV